MKSKITQRKRRGLKTKAIQRDVYRIVTYRSSRHIYAQIVKDGLVFVSCSSQDSEIIANHTEANKVLRAFEVGKLLASKALTKGISIVGFDRSGYKYHGRIKALADGAREAGLNF